MNKKTGLLIKDTIVFALGSLGSKIILFLLVPIYTNYLSTSEYGTAELVSTFSQLLIPIVSVMINSAVIRFTMKAEENKNDVLYAALVIQAFAIILTLLISPILSSYQPISPWIKYLSVQVILSSVSETEKAFLKATNRNREFAIINVLQTAILATTNILFLKYIHLGVKGYLAANNIALAFACVTCFYTINIPKEIRHGQFNFSLLKRMVFFSSPLILNNISWWVIHSSDKIMIEAMVDSSSLGLYTAATKIPSLVNVLTAIFIQAWGLSSIREIESGKDTKFISSVFSAFSTLVFGAGIFIVSLIKPFMNLYVGESFRNAWVFTPLLLSAAVFYAVSSYFGSLYTALQRTVNNMWSTILCALINVVFNYIFILRVGAWGAIIGTVVSYFVLACIRIIDIKKHLDMKIDYSKCLLNTLLLLSQSILISSGRSVFSVSGVIIILFIIINRRLIIDMVKSVDRLWNN